MVLSVMVPVGDVDKTHVLHRERRLVVHIGLVDCSSMHVKYSHLECYEVSEDFRNRGSKYLRMRGSGTGEYLLN